MLDHAHELDLAIVLSGAKGAEDLILGGIPACGRDWDASWLGGRCRPGVVPDIAKVAHGDSLLRCVAQASCQVTRRYVVSGRDLCVVEPSASPLFYCK